MHVIYYYFHSKFKLLNNKLLYFITVVFNSLNVFTIFILLRIHQLKRMYKTVYYTDCFYYFIILTLNKKIIVEGIHYYFYYVCYLNVVFNHFYNIRNTVIRNKRQTKKYVF